MSLSVADINSVDMNSSSGMSTGNKIISVLLFIVFFAAGWYMGLSPIQQSIKSSLESGNKIHKLAAFPSLSVPEDYISERQYQLDVLHYSINLDLYPEDQLIKGQVILTATLKDKNPGEIDLNFHDNMKISGLTVDGKPAGYKNEGTRLKIEPESALPDTFNIEINYEGKPDREGFGSFTFGKKYGHWMVYNLSEPNYASTWFPCNDMPSDKALLDMSITNDSMYVSASNGILTGTTAEGGRKTYHWKTIYPISTYLVCLYSSVYKNFSDVYVSQDKRDTMPIEYYAFPEDEENARKDFGGHAGMIDFFSKTFGEYPFIKEKYGVAEFLWQIGAMEHQTLTGIGSNFIGGKRYFTDIYVHELAHQWFGDAVGPESWKDIWLNEGFASYCEALYAEHLAGSKALHSTMMSKFDASFSGTLYDPEDDLFSSLIYDKGAWVLNMLRGELGDKLFFQSLRNYYEKYKYKNASTDDFKEICEETSGRNLDQFFKQWVYEGNNVPDVDYSWTYSKDSAFFNVTLKLQQVEQGYTDYQLPIEFLFRSGSDKTKTERVMMNSDKMEIQIRLDFEPEEVIPDPDNRLLVYFKLTGGD